MRSGAWKDKMSTLRSVICVKATVAGIQEVFITWPATKTLLVEKLISFRVEAIKFEVAAVSLQWSWSDDEPITVPVEFSFFL